MNWHTVELSRSEQPKGSYEVKDSSKLVCELTSGYWLQVKVSYPLWGVLVHWAVRQGSSIHEPLPHVIGHGSIHKECALKPELRKYLKDEGVNEAKKAAEDAWMEHERSLGNLRLC